MNLFQLYFGNLNSTDRLFAESILRGVDPESMNLSTSKIHKVLDQLAQSNWNLQPYIPWLRRLKTIQNQLPMELKTEVVRFFAKVDESIAEKIHDLELEVDSITIEQMPDKLTVHYRSIIQTYLDYCSINPIIAVPEHFLLRQALGYSKLQEEKASFEKEDVILRWEILHKTGLEDQASELFIPDTYHHLFSYQELVFYEAKAQFSCGHFYDVPNLLEGYPKNTPLDLSQRIAKFWVGDRTPETQDQDFLGDWDEA